MQLACRPSRWLAGTRPGIGETFGSPPRCWGAVVSEVVKMRVSSCDPATRPIRPRPSYRTLNQHHLNRTTRHDRCWRWLRNRGTTRKEQGIAVYLRRWTGDGVRMNEISILCVQKGRPYLP